MVKQWIHEDRDRWKVYGHRRLGINYMYKVEWKYVKKQIETAMGRHFRF